MSFSSAESRGFRAARTAGSLVLTAIDFEVNSLCVRICFSD